MLSNMEYHGSGCEYYSKMLSCLEFRLSARARADSANAEVPPTAGETGDTSASHKDEQKRGMCEDQFDLLNEMFYSAFYNKEVCLCEPTKCTSNKKYIIFKKV